MNAKLAGPSTDTWGPVAACSCGFLDCERKLKPKKGEKLSFVVRYRSRLAKWGQISDLPSQFQRTVGGLRHIFKGEFEISLRQGEGVG